MRFLPEPSEPSGERRRRERHDAPFASLLFLSAGIAAFAATRPWTRVQFERLFGEHLGPPGWQSTAGFTCLCTSMLVAVMALAETNTTSARAAVRPASLLLCGLASAALLLEWCSGPGWLRGVSARWTWAFWLGLAAVPTLLAACALRWRSPRYSSSGPPT